MKIYTQLQDTIELCLPELIGAEFDFQPAPENQPGDIGLACFRFAKQLKIAPPQVAAKIAALDFPEIIATVEQAGPYVNFTLDRTAFATDLVDDVIESGEKFGSANIGNGTPVLLEHTSINPNASPHIGRARNGLIGDSLTRLLKFEGYDVDVHYYVNDMGKQIGLLALEIEGEGTLSFDDVLDKYVAANKRAKDDPEFEKRGFELLMKMENGDTEVKDTFTEIVDICLTGQLQVLSRLGLKYDTFDRESTFLTDPRMDEVMNMLREKKALFIDEDKRTVVDLEKLGWERDEGRYIVLMRANGSSMYMYRDIAYTLEKIARAEGHNYIVLGEDHKMYFEQLALIVKAMDHTPPEAIFYNYILLREGKMSTRQGTVVLLSDFLDEVTSRARDKVIEQWPDMPEKEQAEIARMIGIGAVRFTILSVKPNKNVIFDWDEALSFTGDSGPYIQYSCTRIASILRKYSGSDSVDEIPTPSGPVVITHDAEWSLLTRLARLEQDITTAFEQPNLALLATAAVDIARRFSAFYNACSVLNAETDEIKESRIAICMAVRQALINLLGILGIEAPEKM